MNERDAFVHLARLDQHLCHREREQICRLRQEVTSAVRSVAEAGVIIDHRTTAERFVV